MRRIAPFCAYISIHLGILVEVVDVPYSLSYLLVCVCTCVWQNCVHGWMDEGICQVYVELIGFDVSL